MVMDANTQTPRGRGPGAPARRSHHVPQSNPSQVPPPQPSGGRWGKGRKVPTWIKLLKQGCYSILHVLGNTHVIINTGRVCSEVRVWRVQAGSQPQASRRVLAAPPRGDCLHSMEAPNLRKGRNPGPLLPPSTAGITPVQEHMLWGHVDHQGHGDVGLLLVTGRKQAEALLGPVRHRVQTSDWAVGARPGSPKQCRFSPPPGGPPHLLESRYSHTAAG